MIVTTEPELANLRNAKNLIDTLTEIRPNDTKPRLVMNKTGMPKRPEISLADFAGAVGIDPVADIPFDPGLFGTAANNGQMISEVDASNPVAETFVTLAQVVTGRTEVKSSKKSPFDFLKNFKRKK